MFSENLQLTLAVWSGSSWPVAHPGVPRWRSGLVSYLRSLSFLVHCCRRPAVLPCHGIPKTLGISCCVFAYAGKDSSPKPFPACGPGSCAVECSCLSGALLLRHLRQLAAVVRGCRLQNDRCPIGPVLLKDSSRCPWGVR